MSVTTTIGAPPTGAGSVSPQERLAEAFPAVDPGVKPLGSRILVQVRMPMKVSKGGIILADESKDAEKWNTQIALVIMCGPVAFHSRDTLAPWPEGDWCEPGDFVRVAKYGGDRFEVPLDDHTKALFVIFNDLEIIAKVTGDPLKIIAYV